ncbi:MAG: serine/threonine protein kinase [Symploca sp. SIO1B1]|nr:serine/threonine protein kinase [Symploca sp. SIO1B1]
MDLAPGTTLHKGKYILNNQIGTGFFSLTYQATSKSGQVVVIKTLAENLCQHPDFSHFQQQFLGLAQRLRRCQHPHLVSVLDYFEEAGHPYLVMEYIPGRTLGQIIQTQVLSERKARKYVHQVGDALSHLHQFGLLHRDIKPQNIILRQDSDYVVLCELGITCDLTPGTVQTHASLLSSGYLPPEQYVSEYQRTKATDIYALAATFYCLLTGYPPLPVPVRKVLQAGGSDNLFPSNAQQSAPKLSREAMQAIRCGLELATDQRPQTVEAWLGLIPLPKRLKQPGERKKEWGAEEQRSGGVGELGSWGVGEEERTDNFWIQSSRNPTQNFVHPKQPRNTSQLGERKKGWANKSADAKTRKRQDTETGRIEIPTKISLTPSKAVARKLPLKKLPLKALLMTGAIAASAGLGFGFALRFNSPDTPGSTILHTEQSFPPRSDWPVSEPSL